MIERPTRRAVLEAVGATGLAWVGSEVVHHPDRSPTGDAYEVLTDGVSMPSVALDPVVGWVADVSDGYIEVTDVFDDVVVAAGESEHHVLNAACGEEFLTAANGEVEDVAGDGSLVAIAVSGRVHVIDAAVEEASTEFTTPSEGPIDSLSVSNRDLDRGVVLVSSEDDVSAHDPRSGDVEWRIGGVEGFDVWKRLVFVDRTDGDGRIVHAETGAELFGASWISGFTAYFLDVDSHRYDEETKTGVAFPEPNSFDGVVTVADGQIRSVDAAGAVSWRRSAPAPRPVAVSGSMVYVRRDAVADTSEYFGIDAASGESTRRFGPASDARLVGETLCLAGSGLSLHDVSTGETVFESETDAAAAILGRDEGTLYVEFTTEDGARIVAYDVDGRTERWGITVPASGFHEESPRDDGSLFVADTGLLVVTPRPDWPRPDVEFVRADIASVAGEDADVDVEALSADAVYVTYDDGVAVFDRESGATVWSRESGNVVRLFDSAFVWQDGSELGFVDRERDVEWDRTLGESRGVDAVFLSGDRLWVTHVVDDEDEDGTRLYAFGRSDGGEESTRVFQTVWDERWPDRSRLPEWGVFGIEPNDDRTETTVTAVTPEAVREFGPYSGGPVDITFEANHVVAATGESIHGFLPHPSDAVRHAWRHDTDEVWGITDDAGLCYVDGAGAALDPASGSVVWEFDADDTDDIGSAVYPVFNQRPFDVQSFLTNPKYAGGYGVCRFEARPKQARHAIERAERLRAELTPDDDGIATRLREARDALTREEPTSALLTATPVYRSLAARQRARRGIQSVDSVGGLYGLLADFYGRRDALEHARDALESGESHSALRAVAHAERAVDRARSLTAVGAVLAVGIAVFPLFRRLEQRREPTRARRDLEAELHRVGVELGSTPSWGHARQTYATALERYREGDYAEGLDIVATVEERGRRERALNREYDELQQWVDLVRGDGHEPDLNVKRVSEAFEAAIETGAYDRAEAELEKLATCLEPFDETPGDLSEDRG